ncbi:MAG: DNA mismatch repair protein MutS [Clostridia bacterium]|nr:DNA mismatch repair protein MutS [Clostridia bacterium]
MSPMTPMMQQYFEVKNQYPDVLLFYRLGDFYEMFFDDAITASRALELTLTGRDCGEAERAPMCGVPFHSADSYIGRLIEKGFKVAICEQMEDPAQAKGLVRRDVVRVITPGTVIESTLLPEQKNNYLCSLYVGSNEFGLCFADISTATVFATVLDGADAEDRLLAELGTYAPREVIANLGASRFPNAADYLASRGVTLNDNQSRRYDIEVCLSLVKTQFGDGVREAHLENHALVSAVGALLDYLIETQKTDISYIKELQVYTEGQYMELDINTRRNLELTETMRTKEKKGSLLWVLDRTKTSPGARLLRQWVEHPLLSPAHITRRQGAVEEFFSNFMKREEAGELLSHVLDLERLLTKIVYGTSNAKDLRAVAATAAVLPDLRALLEDCTSEELSRIWREMDTLGDIADEISRAICEEPPFTVREGGMIAPGYDPEVDRLRAIMTDGQGWVERVAAEEKERTGIKTLKVGYNKVFGYYIEVSKSFVGMVPDTYIRKQTLSNCERYITQELKDMEATILGAKDKLCALEYELYNKVRDFVAVREHRVRHTAALLAEVDVYRSLASVASRNLYVRPEIGDDDRITIKDGRHPVVERFVKDSYFVPNDININTRDERLMLITGPNMAGKSTYMRQVALIVLLAQIGSFVPAVEAHIGVVDKMFTRVGASDDLASGQSTFMLEMNEVAYILRNATKKSLIIYDEVGRGTSTFDGMSIARAIIEYTAGRKIGAKTLFATHYHELTTMEGAYDGIVNYHIAAKKRGEGITFLRKIVRGSTDDSYGIEVAKLAGLPNEVIKRAREVLAAVEASSRAVRDAVDADAPAKPEVSDGALTVDDMLGARLVEDIRALDLNTLSPYECMSLMFEWKKQVR